MGRRSGLAKNFTLEHEAVEILQLLAPNRKAQGVLISSLLRAEEQRRIAARELRSSVVATITAAVAAQAGAASEA